MDKSPEIISIPFCEIPNFPICTVAGHDGLLICGYLNGVPVICLRGRFHYYEGNTLQRATFPIRVLATLGVKTLILTNAAGGLNRTWNLGDIMVITDHINLLGTNPLIGPNADYFPPYSVRFPSMTDCYNPHLRDIAKDCANSLGKPLREGIYVSYAGPTFETLAETQMFIKINASAVGMSTVSEVIVARHCGMNCLALSVMTDICGKDAHPDHFEILKVGERAASQVIAIIKAVVPKILEEEKKGEEKKE